MGRPQILASGTLLKRVRQASYLATHLPDHFRCTRAIWRSGLTRDRLIPFKYLGDHLTRSLRPAQRRVALMGHYDALPKILRSGVGERLDQGIEIWRKDLDDSRPPLSVFLEPSQLAPMEGELQLRFSFRSDLYVLTFLVTPGHVFGRECSSILFIGGIQGRIGSREEIREAARANGEISPMTMLILTVQAVARAIGVDEILAIGDDEHISMAYSPEQIKFNYAASWTEFGGLAVGKHYSLPMEKPQKPLSAVPLTHRGRAKRRREAKRLVREAIERRLTEVIRPGAVPLCQHWSLPAVSGISPEPRESPSLPAVAA